MSKREDRLAQLRRRKEKIGNRGTGGSNFIPYFKLPDGVELWKPDKGKHTIDILPYFAGKNDPNSPEGEWAYTLDIFVHQNLGVDSNMQMVCPQQTYDNEDPRWEKCPICEENAKRWDEGDEDGAKEIWPKRRTLFNVLVLDNEEEEKKGIQVFEVAYTYMLKILEEKEDMYNDDNGIEVNVCYSDPGQELGRSIRFMIKKKTVPIAGKPTEIPDYVAHEFMKRDYDYTDDELNDCHCLDKFLNIPTYDELHEAFYGEEKEEKKTTRTTSRTSTKSSRIRKEEKEEPPFEPDDVNKVIDDCPSGHVFGEDCMKHPEDCEECDKDIFTACHAKQNEMKKEEPEKEEKKISNRRSRRSRISK